MTFVKISGLPDRFIWRRGVLKHWVWGFGDVCVPGYVLVCLGIFGCVWGCLRCMDISYMFAMFGYVCGVWIHLDTFGYICDGWMHLEIFGYIWIHLRCLGTSVYMCDGWVQLGTFEYVWVYVGVYI